MSKNEDLIEDSVVAYGRLKAIGSSIVGCIIVIVFCAIGLFMIKSNLNKSFNYTVGKITSISCNLNNQCSISLQYTVNNVVYDKTGIMDRNQNPIIGNIISVYYNSSDPNDFQLQSPASTKGWGFGLMGIGCLVLIGISVHLYLVMTYDQAAVESAFSTSNFSTSNSRLNPRSNSRSRITVHI
jgi:hypothetical protein